MILLIDAYNLSKKYFRCNFINQSQCQDFVDKLGSYSKKKNHKIILVFDGYWDFDLKEKKLVKIIFSGNETADDYIKNFIDNNKLMDIAVISSDNEIKDFGFKNEVPVINSEFFIELLNKKDLEKSKKIIRGSDPFYKLHNNKSNEFLDNLMIEGSEYIQRKDNFQDLRDKKEINYKALKSNKKLSKFEKKLINVYKKL